MTTILETKSAKPTVSSHGYSDARIFFISGHPSNDDLMSGMALSGYQETMIDSFLRPLKISTKQCYFSIFIKERLEYNGANPKKLKVAIEKIDLDFYKNML